MMTQEPFKILPSEIIISILSKLPPRAILICKCVCKSWLNLVETQEFVKSHLSTSMPGLVTFHEHRLATSLKYFEMEDGQDVEHHDLRYNLAASFSFPHARWLCGSVDGLLWLRDHGSEPEPDTICICNPITRDYIKIHSPPEFPCTTCHWATYGFGLCRMTGQYKVVRILIDKMFNKESGYGQTISTVECHVYTLGSGCGWRRLTPCPLNCVTPTIYQYGAFVNGNLHWLGCDSNRCLWISCFDLETESFRTFPAPLPLRGAPEQGRVKLSAWDGSLCLCDSTQEDDIVILLMEEYEIGKHWTKKLDINRKIHGEYFAFKLFPLKVFKDGDILMGVDDCKLYYFSNKTKTTQQVDMFKVDHSVAYNDRKNIKGIIHTPSFRSLKSFGMENVSSF